MKSKKEIEEQLKRTANKYSEVLNKGNEGARHAYRLSIEIQTLEWVLAD